MSEVYVGKIDNIEQRQGGKGPYTFIQSGNEWFYVHGAQGRSVLQEFRVGENIEVRYAKAGKFKNVESLTPFHGTVPAVAKVSPGAPSGGFRGGYKSGGGKSPEDRAAIEVGMVFNKAMEYLTEQDDASSVEGAVKLAVSVLAEVKKQMLAAPVPVPIDVE